MWPWRSSLIAKKIKYRQGVYFVDEVLEAALVVERQHGDDVHASTQLDEVHVQHRVDVGMLQRHEQILQRLSVGLGARDGSVAARLHQAQQPLRLDRRVSHHKPVLFHPRTYKNQTR